LTSQFADVMEPPWSANLVQRISKFLIQGGEVNPTIWQLRQVKNAIKQVEEERVAEGERTMSEGKRPDLYEPGAYVPEKPIERQHLVDELAAVVAAA
jgi:hypothetical protein